MRQENLPLPTIQTFKSIIIMKKFLEVLIDETNHFHFRSDMDYRFMEIDQEHQHEFDQLIQNAMEDLIRMEWKEQKYELYPAIRFLSIVEMLCCRQPYEQLESFWEMMLFDTIPYFEQFATKLKIPYGYSPSELTRPLTGYFGSETMKN